MDFPSFEELLELAKNNPESLERLRQRLIDQTIRQAPLNDQRRLRGLQFQIDAISSAFLYKGYIGSDGRIVHIDVLHANHNVPFENAAIFN